MAHQQKYEEVTTDAGYESLENYLYLEANGQVSFIKPANYEAQKTKKYRSQIGRIENMKYDENTGVQPQEAVDEAGKKTAGNPLFREKSCLTGSKHKIIHRRL